MAREFSPYQRFAIAVLAFLQFTVVLDFMILSPLGAILIDEMSITPRQFGLVVSGYAFSAGASGLLTAGFADRFDRRKLLIFFYSGFILGTAFCGLAPNYEALLLARVVTGIFGGVIASISLSIVTDLFPLDIRGRAMGMIMSAFSASQVLGIPIGLFLANKLGWHSAFFMIVVVSLFVWVIIVLKMKPVREHLEQAETKSFFNHIFGVLSNPAYLYGFLITALLTIGGFLLMPFSSAFSVNNLGVTLDELPLVFMVAGAVTIFTVPLSGRLSDSHGKYKVFALSSLAAMVLILYYTGMGLTPLWLVIAINTTMFVAISFRMPPASALTSAIPLPPDRGAFMSVNSSLRQIFGGLGSVMAGYVVSQSKTGKIRHYQILGVITAATMILAIILMYRVYLNHEKTDAKGG